MRKLVLFGLLGGVFGLALLLEHFVTRPGPQQLGDDDHLVAVLGGYPPREIPPTPPDENGGGAPPVSPPAKRGDGSDRAKPPPNRDGERGDDRSDLPTASAKEHVVEKGETLKSIAKAQLGATNRWHDLALWNGITDPETLKPGAHLRLAPPDGAKEPPKVAQKEKTPAAGERSYRIAKGDTLSHIAAQFLGDASRWREIQRLNDNIDPANLTEGRLLQLPPR